jgi:SAM-dependent methyltransferase
MLKDKILIKIRKLLFSGKSLIHKMMIPYRTSVTQVIRQVGRDTSLVKFDLGGVGKGKNGWKTVNLLAGVDIQEDILNIDAYCQNNSVDVFLMSHTYEHLPITKSDEFIKKLLKKLKKDGKLIIVQTDIKRTLELYKQKKIDFYCLRDIIFSSIDRRKASFDQTGKDLILHQYMWGALELKEELLSYGFSRVEIIEAWSWEFDFSSVFSFQKNEKYFGVEIPNLGIEAYK